MKKINRINKHWIAGFIDGDGSFALDKVGNFYRPSLSISQNDFQLLSKIKDFFGCGSVTQKSAKAWQYRCRSTKQFQNFIIPKLGDRPFQTKCQYHYQLTCEDAMPLLTNSNHLEHQAILDQIDTKIRSSRHTPYSNPNPINLDWFLGFFEAEGSFFLEARKPGDVRIAYKVSQKDLDLLKKIQGFFNYGLIHSEGREGIWKYSVEGKKTIIKHGYKLFINHPFNGRKNLERVKFLKAIRILSENDGIRNSIETEKAFQKLSQISFEIREFRKK